MIRAVIFDFDGVLCQTETFFLDDRIRYFSSLGVEVTAKQLSTLAGYTGLDRERLYDDILGNQETYWRLKDEILAYRPNVIPHRRLRTEGIVPLLEELKKRHILIGVASNSSEERLHRVLYDCEIHEYFDIVMYPTKDTRKPHPYVYLETMKQLQVSKDECLVVEDSVIGIQAGKAAGMKVLALRDRDGLVDQSQADAVITNIQQVLDYL